MESLQDTMANGKKVRNTGIMYYNLCRKWGNKNLHSYLLIYSLKRRENTQKKTDNRD